MNEYFLDVKNFILPKSFGKCAKPIEWNIIKLVFLYECLNSYKKSEYSGPVKKRIFEVA